MDEAEKSRIKAEAARMPQWCDGMVHTCEQRNAALINASSETRSKCEAYCRNLQIEKCHPSSTLQEAAQACTTMQQRDQRAKGERAAKAEESRKWHCFGEVGNVNQGSATAAFQTDALASENRSAMTSQFGSVVEVILLPFALVGLVFL